MLSSASLASLVQTRGFTIRKRCENNTALLFLNTNVANSNTQTQRARLPATTRTIEKKIEKKIETKRIGPCDINIVQLF
jgi:hypothetical protein